MEITSKSYLSVLPNSVEIEECSQMPKLIEALKSAGFSNEDIEKIAYKNVFRVLKTTLPSKSKSLTIA